MIAAVNPTRANSRNGTPALRSERASKPPARLATSLDISRPYFTNLRRLSGDQAGRVHTQYLGNAFGAHRSLAQDARSVSAQVENRRGGLLCGRSGVEVSVDK